MLQTGFALVDGGGTVIASYGDIPEPLALPNGDYVNAAQVNGQYAEWRLVGRWLDDQPPGPLYAKTGSTTAFDGTKVIVTITYESTPSIVPPPAQITSQDLMAQFTAADAAEIQAAVSGNAQFWLLWSAMQAQKDPMIVTNPRFLAGWVALTQVLGAPRMAAIAAALNVTIS